MYSIKEVEEKLHYISKHSSEASRYEMLAEEAQELAHAAQKMARYLRDEQPVAESFDPTQEKNHILEEYTDMTLAFEVIVDLHDDVFNKTIEMYETKLDRWVDRLKNQRKSSCS